MAHKPMPDLNEAEHAVFWEGTARGLLHIRHCAECGRDQWPPRLGCVVCGSDRLGWKPVRGSGTVFSWTVVHRSLTPGFDPPYTVVLVELDEAPGVRLIGNLVDGTPAVLRGGLAVEAVFTPSDDSSVTLVCWRPAVAAPG